MINTISAQQARSLQVVQYLQSVDITPIAVASNEEFYVDVKWKNENASFITGNFIVEAAIGIFDPITGKGEVYGGWDWLQEVTSTGGDEVTTSLLMNCEVGIWDLLILISDAERKLTPLYLVAKSAIVCKDAIAAAITITGLTNLGA